MIGRTKQKNWNLFAWFFIWKTENLTPIVVTISTLSVKKSGMGLQNPATQAAEKYTSLLHASYELICAVTGESAF